MLIMTSQAEVSDLSSEANSSGRRDDVANCGTGGRANPGDKPCLSLMGWTLNGQSLAQLRFFLPLDPLKGRFIPHTKAIFLSRPQMPKSPRRAARADLLL